MAYTEQVWLNGVAGNTPTSAQRFNHMEAGIGNAATVADEALALAETAVQLPVTPPAAGQVLVVLSVSPLVLGWENASAGGSSGSFTVTDPGSNFAYATIDPGADGTLTDNGTYATFDTGTSATTIADHGTYATLTG